MDELRAERLTFSLSRFSDSCSASRSLSRFTTFVLSLSISACFSLVSLSTRQMASIGLICRATEDSTLIPPFPYLHSLILSCSHSDLGVELPPGPISYIHPHGHVALDDVGCRVQQLQVLEPLATEVATATGLELDHGGVCVGLHALVQLREDSRTKEHLHTDREEGEGGRGREREGEGGRGREREEFK